MTLREQLLAVRAIVADSSDEPNRCGCIEDAICRVFDGGSWWRPDARQNPKRLRQSNAYYEGERLPMYKALRAGTDGQSLWSWNDQHTKAQRLELIDSAINKL